MPFFMICVSWNLVDYTKQVNFKEAKTKCTDKKKLTTIGRNRKGKIRINGSKMSRWI